MTMRDAIFKLLARPVCICFAAVCCYLAHVPDSLARSDTSVDVCQEPTGSSHVSVAYYRGEKASIDGGAGEISQENFVFDLLYKFQNKWSIGVGHRYSIFKFDPLEPQTNGHLHTLFVPLHRQTQSDRNSFRFSIAPALSASSNVMKDPGEYDADALQLLAALVWGRPLSDKTSLRYGVCGDHRFGSYQIYPLISFDWQPHADWRVELGFPTLLLGYQISGRFSSALRFTPNGNEWNVKDKSLAQQSEFVYEAYLLEWGVEWQLHKQFSLSASVGRVFDNEYELTLLDGTRVQLATDPFTRFGAALTWRF